MEGVNVGGETRSHQRPACRGALRLSKLLYCIAVVSQTAQAVRSVQDGSSTTTPSSSIPLLGERGRQLPVPLTPLTATISQVGTNGGGIAVQAQTNGGSQRRDKEGNSTESHRRNGDSPSEFSFCEVQHSRLSTGGSATFPTSVESASGSPATSADLPTEFVFVLHRHGARSSSSYASSTPRYGGTQPGQLLPLGATQLRDSGFELRRRLLSTFIKTRSDSLSRETTHRLTRTEPTSFSSDARNYSIQQKKPGAAPRVVNGHLDSNGLTPKEARGLTGENKLPGMPANVATGLSSKSVPLDSDDMLWCLAEADMVTDCGPHTYGLSALLQLLPPPSVLVRATAYPRTKWSALAFLEGLYGLPRGCFVSPDDLARTEGKKSGEPWCVTRTVCADVVGTRLTQPTSTGFTGLSANNVAADEFAGEAQRCVEFTVPCVMAAPAASDGLLKGMISSDAPPEVWKLYGDIKAKPAWIHKVGELDKVLRIAAEVFGDKAVGEMGWIVGEMLVSEEAAGEQVPLKKLSDWFASRKEGGHLEETGLAQSVGGSQSAEGGNSKPSETHISRIGQRLSAHVAGAGDAGDYIKTYRDAIGGIREAFRAGFDLVYADKKLSRYIAQGCVRLLNAFLRAKAYGRPTDIEELRRAAAEVGGFEGFLRPEPAVGTDEKNAGSGGEFHFSSRSEGDDRFLQQVQNLMVMLLSLHDHSIIGFLASLGVYDHSIIPPGARVVVELVRMGSPMQATPGATHDAENALQREAPFAGERGPGTIPKKVPDAVRHEKSKREQQPSTRITDVAAATTTRVASAKSSHDLPSSDGLSTQGRPDWSPSGFFVRVLYGEPERPMREVALPFCAEEFTFGGRVFRSLCPLHIWLRRTYEALDR
uniref:Histidine acid phosphatase superfamily protein n=1 Tax=Toxoplasma gondii COUG TaxID=1074873 RepID=A0A2G8Y7D3_TOXGO|nr:histidine acid phosphatase superfamily protein [Toxoplasma gondii COUG]